MKLARITKPLRAVQVRVILNGDLNASLERYVRYYEHIHGEAVETRTLIAEVLRVFLDADREFQSWARSPEKTPPRRIATPAQSGATSRAQP